MPSRDIRKGAAEKTRVPEFRPQRLRLADRNLSWPSSGGEPPSRAIHPAPTTRMTRSRPIHIALRAGRHYAPTPVAPAFQPLLLQEWLKASTETSSAGRRGRNRGPWPERNGLRRSIFATPDFAKQVEE